MKPLRFLTSLGLVAAVLLGSLWSTPGALGREGVISVPGLGTPLPIEDSEDALEQNTPSGPTRAALVEPVEEIPLAFEANRGQADEQVLFVARASGYTLFLTRGEGVLALLTAQAIAMDSQNFVAPGPDGGFQVVVGGEFRSAYQEQREAEQAYNTLVTAPGPVLRLGLVGANPEPEVQGLKELPGKANHFRKDDPAQWIGEIPTYAEVRKLDIYPGVEQVWYGDEEGLEQGFVVAPGADPSPIGLFFEGADSLQVRDLGELVINAGGAEVRLHRPQIFQEDDGVRREISGGYTVSGDQVSFWLEDYDASLPLSIYPVLTYLDGSGDDFGNGTAVNSAAAAGAWRQTGSMTIPRIRHTATLLSNSLVLVAGGLGPSNQPAPAPQLIPVSSAEIFNPTTGAWTSTGSMGTPRVGHAAALLPDGRVLVAGGLDRQDTPLASAEIFTSSTGAWTPTGNLSQARAYLTATTLNDGRVLVVGNTVAGTDANKVEIFDPATGTWSITGSLNQTRLNLLASPRPDGAATRLADGRVLFVSFARFAEVFDPATGTWTPTGDVLEIAARPAAILLSDGRVLVAGGLNCPAGSPCFVTRSAELYNPATNGWTVTGSMALTRDQHTATLVPSGWVLVAGGDQGNTATSELFDPATGTWSSAGSMVTVDFRFAHTATRLDDGRVLVAGGQGSPSPAGGAVATAELFFDPTIPPPPPGDTVKIKTARYDLAKQALKVEATSTSSSATLMVSVASTGQTIGRLTNEGGGKYKGQFQWSPNPQSVIVRSSLGGEATAAVAAK